MDNEEENIIKIYESSNLKLGSGSRIWECVNNCLIFYLFVWFFKGNDFS